MGVKIPYRCVSSSTILIFGLLFQCSDKLGLSLELGSFAAGVMISTTDLARHTLEQVRLFFPIRSFYLFFFPLILLLDSVRYLIVFVLIIV